MRRCSHSPNFNLYFALFFSFDYTPIHPHFSFYFICIYLFIFLPEKNGRRNPLSESFFLCLSNYTACSEFAFDFSTLLGIFWTISGVFDSPFLGKV